MKAIRKQREGTDCWDEISEAKRTAIEESIAGADRRKLIPHEDVMK